ncbi:DUF692 domain-containing protein [Chitinophagaceae bacterium MMS25-I14]
MNDFLGVGILYNPSLDGFFRLHPEAIDYIEIIPDILFTDNGVGVPDRFEMSADSHEKLLFMGGKWPLVAHHVGFSLGTAGYFDTEYLQNVVRLQQEYNFLWNSDHLSYSKVHDEEVTEFNTCLSLPLPFDHEVLEMLAEKIRTIRKAVNTPFLIENNVYFVEIRDEEYAEGAFLKKLSEQSDCGMLLDLHNVHANATNFNFDRKVFVDSLDLSTVQEIHIAGGGVVAGMHLDSHSGPCNEEVWELLDYVVPKCNALRGVTFEFHESYFESMGHEGIAAQLDRAREICNKYKKTAVCL